MEEARAAEPLLGAAERHLLDVLPERALVCRRGGRIAWANALAASLLGRDAASLLGRDLGELVWPESAGTNGATPGFLERLAALPAGEGEPCTALHRTGTHIRVELAASSFGEDSILVLLRQLPARDVATDARVHPQTSELVFEGAPVGIFHFDAEGEITACNDAFVRIIGSSRRVLVGLRIETLPDAQMVECMRQALAGRRTRYEGDYRSATAGKTTAVRVDFAPIFDEQRRVIGGVGIAEDVTERKRAEEARERSMRSMRVLLERAPDAIAVRRGERFLFVNPTLVRMLGYGSPEELLAVPVSGVLHPEELDTWRELASRELREGEGLQRQIRLRRRDGETLLAEMATMTIDFEGAPAVLSFTRDITQRKALETRLAQADRLASVGTLAAGVAHEINNPLAYVMANLDLMARQLSRVATGSTDAQFFEEALHHAREGCERVRLIVRDLRTFSRAEEDRRVPVDVCAVIDSVLNMAGHEIRDRARLVRDTPEVPRVLADEARLGQVLINLVLNAAQAIPEGAPDANTIAVSAALCREEGRPDRVEIRISDTGVGIPPESRSRIFEPFWTTKPVGIGTGLGLAIVHGIVRAYGGTIEVESEPGVGTTFRVFLPAAANERSCTGAGEGEGDELPLVQPARILLVDDEARFGEALRAALGERHEIVLAKSGREGLEHVRRGERFDLVLCDLMMPDVTGIAVLEELRRTRPELASRFVLMTGGAYTEEARAFFERLTVPLLEKPFAVAEVERLLARVRAPA